MTASSTRTVARPVANLGNTCYMNAVLQALAHAPELCLAMDCEPHRATCPIAAKCRSASPSPDPDDAGNSKATRKSRRRSPSSSGDNEFCALCEIEQHMKRVHDPTKKGIPVAPSTFVNGFIEHVAPWFRLGVQEDSHEFLRLLIDAMQKSCQKNRPLASQDYGQDQDGSKDQDVEYPFSLFRGTVESNVICSSCKASSATLDPIEDIGLEVTNPGDRPPAPPSSRNSSPLPPNFQLADVQTAFQRFAKAEELDSGYKCEKCGKVGGATKQSRLASIPPILTLQLKRFRYGERVSQAASGRRRSEVNQLNDFGKSGSAKIEGHVKFDMVFDLKPYLTPSLQEKHKTMFCRLFAVIVHAGKNSHSGHYIAYVRDISKNEWWKMDDGRVTPASAALVQQAEAYMLFYRVVQHPVTVRLERDAKERKAVAKPRRKRPSSFSDGVEWARKSKIAPHVALLIEKIQELVAEDVELSPEYFQAIAKEANKADSKVGRGPSKEISGRNTVCSFVHCWSVFMFSNPFSCRMFRRNRRRRCIRIQCRPRSVARIVLQTIKIL